MLLGLFLAFSSPACTVPVFRYALDHWEADFYVLEIPRAAARDLQTDQLLVRLRSDPYLNLEIELNDQPAESDAKLWHPATRETPVWQGQLTKIALNSIMDSPARQKIVDHILSGDSGVWVLVEGADPAANEAEAGRITQRLRYLEQIAMLPQQDPTDPEDRLGPGPELKVGFGAVRVSRETLEERELVRMLAGSAVSEIRDQPFLALVFGRGRVLGAWPAEYLDERALDDACLFLLGACSCQVKQQNPGWDLLLNVDWTSRLEKVANLTEAPVAPAERYSDAVAEKVTFNAGSDPGRPPDPNGFKLTPLMTTAALIAGLAGFLFWKSRNGSGGS